MHAETFKRLLDPHRTAAPTTSQVFSRKELLAAAGITSRQLTYYMQKGVVARPLGNTRAAQYTASHLHQVQRVVELLQNGQVNVSEIAEAYAPHTPGFRPTKRPPVEVPKTCVKLLVYPLTPGVRIFVDENLLPTEERLLAALLKAGKIDQRTRLKLASEALDPKKRVDENLPARRRRASP